MAERNATDVLNLRLPLYAYALPLWHGRRVLEIGIGEGTSAAYLANQGADSVLSIDLDRGRAERARDHHSHPRVEFRALTDLRQLMTLREPFDVILVPEGEAILATPALLHGLRSIVEESGHLVMAVPAADRKGRLFKEGVGFYDLADALAAHFPVVRMLGQTPFLGFGLVEFDGSADALRVDVSLLHGGTEQPSHYVAVAGALPPPALGYALVQVPFAPVEAAVLGGGASVAAPASVSGAGTVPPPTAALAAQAAPAVDSGLAATAEARAQMAERRLDEAERRARARLDEAESRLVDLRRKLEEALIQAESAVRVSRAQAEEIEELRARIRRTSEDRASADDDLAKLRRALAQADESVLTLTRRTAEEMAVVAEKMGTGLARPLVSAPVGTAAPSDWEARVRAAEEASARDRAEVATLTDRVRAADEQIRALKQKPSGIGERDDRIARLEGDKQDLVWRVAELEEKLRHAQAERGSAGATPADLAAVRAARDRAIEELHRGAAAHANEVHRLQSSVAEQAALVAELEDGLRVAEARAAAADKEAVTLRRGAKELEDADRARRARLAELEGKLLRLERERSMAAAAPSGGPDAETLAADLTRKLETAEQRAIIAEQRAVGAEERLAGLAGLRAGAGRNGHDAGTEAAIPLIEVQDVVAEIEDRLRDEMRTLTGIEESLASARQEAARAAEALQSRGQAGQIGADLEQALAAKDSQLVEGRLELARLRRDSETRQTQLEREIAELRQRLNPTGDPGISDDHSQSAQLILMHSTLANIRRRSARLRDELEGFRRRLDTLPPGALSSMLEEIGEDLAEFAK